MFRSLKLKFTLAFGSLIVLLLILLGVFLIDSEARAMREDIGFSAFNFARLSTEDVMQNYFDYLEPGNFIPFLRELSGILRQNEDISSLRIVSYKGMILFDSSEDSKELYAGVRTLDDIQSLNRVQSNYPSFLMDSGEVIYIRVNDDKSVEYLDANEKKLSPPSDRQSVLDIVMPYDNAYALIYDISYRRLEARLAQARIQIIAGALIAMILSLMLSFVLSSGITRPIKELKEGALKLGKGDFKVRVYSKSKDEVGVLARTFNKMAKDLESATQARVYQERVRKELELAAQIQQELLPEEKLKLKHLDIAGGLIPASEIGGDAFDYIKMGEGRYLFYLGDVTGHGVAAGIISSIANAVLYGLKDEKNIKDVVRKLNEVVKAKTTSKVFMTMALTLWDERKGELQYVNAGHPPILYFDASRKKVIEVKQQGMALGFVDNLADLLKVQNIKMKKDDVVLMYSDGVPEAINKKGDQYGLARLRRIVQNAGNDLYTAEGIKNAVLSDVVEFIGSKEHDDDITVLVLKSKI